MKNEVCKMCKLSAGCLGSVLDGVAEAVSACLTDEQIHGPFNVYEEAVRKLYRRMVPSECPRMDWFLI